VGSDAQRVVIVCIGDVTHSGAGVVDADFDRCVAGGWPSSPSTTTSIGNEVLPTSRGVSARPRIPPTVFSRCATSPVSSSAACCRTWHHPPRHQEAVGWAFRPLPYRL